MGGHEEAGPLFWSDLALLPSMPWGGHLPCYRKAPQLLVTVRGHVHVHMFYNTQAHRGLDSLQCPV